MGLQFATLTVFEQYAFYSLPEQIRCDQRGLWRLRLLGQHQAIQVIWERNNFKMLCPLFPFNKAANFLRKRRMALPCLMRGNLKCYCVKSFHVAGKVRLDE